MKPLLICVALCLSACSYQYTAQQTARFAESIGAKPQTNYTRLRSVTLSPLNEVCVSRGFFDNGQLAEDEFYQQLSDSLLNSFQQWFVSVKAVNAIESQKSALRSAYRQRCELLVYPMVLERKDKVWSVVEWDAEIESWEDIGLDQLQLRLSIWDVNNGELLDMTVLSSRGAWLQIGKTGSDDLLVPTINKYLQNLVAVQ